MKLGFMPGVVKVDGFGVVQVTGNCNQLASSSCAKGVRVGKPIPRYLITVIKPETYQNEWLVVPGWFG